MTSRLRQAALLALCALAGLGGQAWAQRLDRAMAPAGSEGQRPSWWDMRWRRRALLTISADQPWAGAPGAYVWVHVPEGADYGGRDIRIVSPQGEMAPSAVLYGSPEGRYLVAFQAPRKVGFWAAYYDNPNAPETPDAPPRQGIVYETRPIPKGASVNSWADAQAVLARAAPPYGAALWNRVFDAVNPFGPQSDYIAVYRGYIRCPSAGTYGFATVSDNSSFLLIDGRMVGQWVGPHNIGQGRRGEHGGTVELTQGMHEFMYVHFAFGGALRAAAAWQPPGEDRYQTIPLSAFPGLPEAEVYEVERYGQPVCADFTFAPDGYLEAGGAEMVAVKFASKSTAAGGALIGSYHWDFGDGQTADEPQPKHVFLSTGLRKVTLAVTSTAGDRASVAKQVKLGTLWNDLDFTLRKKEEFWSAVKVYGLQALPTADLLAAWDFAHDVQEQQAAFRIARELEGRRQELKPQRLYDVAMELARCEHEVERRPDRAEQYLRLALESVPRSDAQRRFDAGLALCDHYFYYLDDPERARREYATLRADFPQTDPGRRRMALIRIGDTYLYEGKAAEASAAYREAEADPAFVSDQPRAIVVGAGLIEVASYLRRGEGDEALKRLENLLWTYPTMRLEGEPTVLRVQANLVRKDFMEAKKQADIYLRSGRDPNFLPAVHVEAAEACIELGLVEEARQHYRKVLDEFPESPQVKDAENGLRRLGT